MFGGGPWARILHPFLGLLMVLGFAVLFAQVWRDNLWTPLDSDWLRHSGQLISGHEEGMTPVAKYNAGQKLVFWVSATCLGVLLATGFVFWRQWFADAYPLPLRRAAVVLHATAAAILILSVIVHAYAAIWVKGSVRAMTRGAVSEAWARRHHRLWYCEISGGR